MPQALVEYQAENHIATITMNDPKTLNAFSTVLKDAMMNALTNADEDKDDHNDNTDKSLEAANIEIPRKVDNAQFREMFNQAETIVQTIEHEDGRKVFQNRAVQK